MKSLILSLCVGSSILFGFDLAGLQLPQEARQQSQTQLHLYPPKTLTTVDFEYLSALMEFDEGQHELLRSLADDYLKDIARSENEARPELRELATAAPKIGPALTGVRTPKYTQAVERAFERRNKLAEEMGAITDTLLTNITAIAIEDQIDSLDHAKQYIAARVTGEGFGSGFPLASENFVEVLFRLVRPDSDEAQRVARHVATSEVWQDYLNEIQPLLIERDSERIDDTIQRCRAMGNPQPNSVMEVAKIDRRFGREDDAVSQTNRRWFDRLAETLPDMLRTRFQDTVRKRTFWIAYTDLENAADAVAEVLELLPLSPSAYDEVVAVQEQHRALWMKYTKEMERLFYESRRSRFVDGYDPARYAAYTEKMAEAYESRLSANVRAANALARILKAEEVDPPESLEKVFSQIQLREQRPFVPN